MSRRVIRSRLGAAKSDQRLSDLKKAWHEKGLNVRAVHLENAHMLNADIKMFHRKKGYDVGQRNEPH